MKKQFGLPLMLASALAFSACSSEDVADNGGGKGYDFTKGGYMAVNINLPSKTASGFKAADGNFNDQFDDGLPSEYAVKKATLVLFTGTKDGDAKFHSIYDLGDISMAMDGTPQITSTVKVVKDAKNDVQGKQLMGLVILNGGTLVGTNPTNPTINGVTLTANTTTFSDLVNSVTTGNASKYSSDGFLMMNAPLATQKGGSTAPTSADADVATLVNLSDNVYGTKEETLANTAANFYVERALAKVTFNHSKGQIKGTDITLNGTSQAGVMNWDVEKWSLDVTNTKSYFVHNMTGIDNILINNTLNTDITVRGALITDRYRFIGSEPVREGVAKYRTYWGVDPNYKSYVADFDTKTPDAEIGGDLGAEKPQYCFENTFDVANQKQNQTTRAIVKVKLNDGTDFYVFNGDKSKLYKEDGCKKRIMGDIANLKTVHDWIVENLKAGTYDITANAEVTLGNSANYTKDAKVKVTAFSVKIPAAQAGGTEMTYTATATDITNLNNALKNNVTKYEGGIAYYPIRIKHFGNDLTPWNNYVAPTPGTPGTPGNPGGHKAIAGDVYGLTADPTNAPARFLGRYGVLRNNWYELEVSGITGIGEPRVPQVTEDPDDELKQYISVNINILSWAKRVQKEEL